MPSKRRFCRTVVKVEVLSEEPLPERLPLEGLAHSITEGDCSGVVSVEEAGELDGPGAAKALRAQGSDPCFFELTEDGEDIEVDSEVVCKFCGRPCGGRGRMARKDERDG